MIIKDGVCDTMLTELTKPAYFGTSVMAISNKNNTFEGVGPGEFCVLSKVLYHVYINLYFYNRR